MQTALLWCEIGDVDHDDVTLAISRYIHFFIKCALALAFVESLKVLTEIVATINEAPDHGQLNSNNLHLQIVNPRGEFLFVIGVATNISPMTEAFTRVTC